MPAIQENFVRREKNSRTPQGSLERKPCFMPHLIDKDVDLSGDGIFVCKNIYYRYYRIYTPEEYKKNYDNINSEFCHSKDSSLLSRPKRSVFWSGNPGLPVHDEHERSLLTFDRLNTQRKGSFYND